MSTTREVAVAGVEFSVALRHSRGDTEFWTLFSGDAFEPAIVAALVDELGPGRRLLDLGAWIGPMTLLGAALGAEVVAFEADAAATDALRANLALNPHIASRVEVQAAAISTRRGTVRVDTSRGGPGGGLSRVTTSRADPFDVADAVDAVDARSIDLARFDVVKVDIEGGEYSVVPLLAPQLRQHRPTLLLSLHGPTPATHGRALVARLRCAPRQARLMWSLRGYDEIGRVRSHRHAEIVPLGRIARLALVFRLGEIELVCRTANGGE